MNTRRKFMKEMGLGALTVGVTAPGILSFRSVTVPEENQSAPFGGMQTFNDQPDQDGVFVITKGEHKPDEILSALAEMKPVMYQPPSDRWLNLPLTVSALKKDGAELKVVMLGDSIVNDTYRSQWYDLLRARYPKCKITATGVVRGSTGCWWYKDEDRVKKYVLPLNPDLLIIGGISQNNDTESIREVIRQVTRSKPCDVLLMTGAFGETDPNDDSKWAFDLPRDSKHYNRRLYELSKELKAGFVDMNAHWGLYVKESGRPVGWFHRDEIHANIKGEQILGHLLAAHLSPPLPW